MTQKSTSNSEPVRTPCQDRSRATLARILDSTEALLEERPFEDISVSAIVRHAKTSVGAFYARFRDKDALLPALYARYDRWVGREATIVRETRPWESGDAGTGGNTSLERVVNWLIRELVMFFNDRRNLMRAVALHARIRPEKIDAATRARRVRDMEFMRQALLSCREEMQHPDAERAVDVAIFFAAASMREAILFGSAPHAASTGVSLAELEREAARHMYAYLSARQ